MTSKSLIPTNQFDIFDDMAQLYFPDRYDWDNLKPAEKWDAFTEIWQDDLKDFVFEPWNPEDTWTGINHYGFENQPTVEELLMDTGLESLYGLHENADDITKPFFQHFPDLDTQIKYMAAFAAKGPEQNDKVRNQLLDFVSYAGWGLVKGETTEGVAHPEDVDIMSYDYLKNFYTGHYKLDANKDGVWDLQNDKILAPGDEGNPITKNPEIYGTYKAGFNNALDIWFHEVEEYNFPEMGTGTLEGEAAYADFGVMIDSNIPKAKLDKYKKYFNPDATIDIPIISAAQEFLGIESDGLYTKAKNKISTAEVLTFNPLSLFNHPTLERIGPFEGKGLDVLRHTVNNSLGTMFMGDITGYHGYTGVPYYDEDGDIRLVGGIKYSNPDWVDKNHDRFLFSAASGLGGLLDPLSATSFFGSFQAGGAAGRNLSVGLLNKAKKTNTGKLFNKFGAPARVKSVMDFAKKRLPSNDYTRKLTGVLKKHVFTPDLFVNTSSSIGAFGLHGFVNGILTSRYNQRFSEVDEYGNALGTIDVGKTIYDGTAGFWDSLTLGSIMGLSNHAFSKLSHLSNIYGRKNPTLRRVGTQIENNKFLRGAKNTITKGGRIVAEGTIMTAHDVFKHSDDFLLQHWNGTIWENVKDENDGTQYDWNKIGNAGGSTVPFLIGLKGIHKATNRVLKTLKVSPRPKGPIRVTDPSKINEKYKGEEILDENQRYDKNLDKTIENLEKDIKYEEKGENPEEVKTREEILEKVKNATNEDIYEIIRQEGIKEFTPTKDSEIIQYKKDLLETMKTVRDLIKKISINKDGVISLDLKPEEKLYLNSESVGSMDIYTGGILQDLSTDVGLARFRKKLEQTLGREPSVVEFNKYKALKQQEVDNWHVIKADLIDRVLGPEAGIQTGESQMHPESVLGSGKNKKRTHVKVKLDKNTGLWKPVLVKEKGKDSAWIDKFNKKESELLNIKRMAKGEGWMDYETLKKLDETKDFAKAMGDGKYVLNKKNPNLFDNILSGEEKAYDRTGEVVLGKDELTSYSKKSVDKLIPGDQHKVPLIEKSFEREGLYKEEKDMADTEIPEGLYNALTGRPDGIIRREIRGKGKKNIPVIKFTYNGKEQKQELVVGNDGVFVKLGDSKISHIVKSFDKAFLSDWLLNTRHHKKDGKKKYRAVATELGMINTLLKVTGKKGIIDLTSRDMLEFYRKMQVEREKLGYMGSIDSWWRSLPMELSNELQQRFGKKEFWSKNTKVYKDFRKEQEQESIERISIRNDLLKKTFKTKTGDMNLTKVVNTMVEKVKKLKDIKLNKELPVSEKLSNEKQSLYVDILMEYALRSSELNRLTFSHIVEKGEFYQIDLLKNPDQNYKVKGRKDPDGFTYTKNVKGMAKGEGHLRKRIIEDKYVQEIKRIMKEEGKTKEDLIFGKSEAGVIKNETAEEVNTWLNKSFGKGAVNSRAIRSVVGRLLTETVPKGKRLENELKLEPHEMNLWNHMRGGGTDPFFKNTGLGVSSKHYTEYYNEVPRQIEIQNKISTRLKEVLKLSEEAPKEAIIEETLKAMDAGERISEGINEKGNLKEGYTESELTEDLIEVTQTKIKADEIKKKTPEEIKTEAPEYKDGLTPSAINYTIKYSQVSMSLLMNRYDIGYKRAGRLIEELESLGVIKPYIGEKPATAQTPRWITDKYLKAPIQTKAPIETIKVEEEKDVKRRPKSQVYKTSSKELPKDKGYIPNQSIIDGWEKGYINIDGKIITRKDYVNAVKNKTGMPDAIYSGVDGNVSLINLGSKTIFKVYKGGDTPISFLKELRKDSKAIEMGIEKVPDTHAAANEFIAKYFKGEGYDFVEFSNVSRKQLGIEYIYVAPGKGFLNTLDGEPFKNKEGVTILMSVWHAPGKSFAEKVEHAELYAKQSGRGEKYKEEDADFTHPIYGKTKQISSKEINKSLNVSKKQLSEESFRKILPKTRKDYHDRFNMKDPDFGKPAYRGNMPFDEFGIYRPIFSMKVGGKEAFFYRSSAGTAGAYRGKLMPFLGVQKNWVMKDVSGKGKSFEESLAKYPKAIKKATKHINEKIPMEKEFKAKQVKYGATSEMITKGQEAWDKYIGEHLKVFRETKPETIGETVTRQDWINAIKADFKDILSGTLNKIWSKIQNTKIGLTIEITDPEEFIRKIKTGEIKPKERLDELEPVVDVISRDIDLKIKPLDALSKVHSIEGTLRIKNKTALKNYVKVLKRRFEELRRSENYNKEELSGLVTEVASLAKVVNPESFKLSEKTDSRELTKVGEFLTKYPGQAVEQVKFYKKLNLIEDIEGLAILNNIKPGKLKEELLNIHNVKDGDFKNATIPKLKSIKEFYYTQDMINSPLMKESFQIEARNMFNETQKNTTLWKRIRKNAFTAGAMSGARGQVLDIIRAIGRSTSSKMIENIASDLVNHDVLKKNIFAKFDKLNEKAIEIIETDTDFMVGPMRVRSYIAEGVGGLKDIARKLGLRATGDYPGPIRRRIAEHVLRKYIYKNMKYLDKGYLEDQSAFMKFDKKSKTNTIDIKEKKNAEKFLNRVFENPKTRTVFKNTAEGKIVKVLTEIHKDIWTTLMDSYRFHLTETEFAWLDSKGYFKPVKSGFYLHRKFSKEYGNAKHLFNQSQEFETMHKKEINKETDRLIKVYSDSKLLDGKPYDKNNPHHFNVVRTNAIDNVVNSVFQGYEFSENSLEPSVALKRKTDLPRRVWNDTKNKWVETREVDFENVLSSYLRKAGNQIATIRYFPWVIESSKLKSIKSLQKPSVKREFFNIMRRNVKNEGSVGIIMDAIMYQTELYKGEKWYHGKFNKVLTGTGAWMNRRIVKNTLMLAAPKNLGIGMINNALQSEVGKLLMSNLKMLDISTARKMRGEWGFMEHATQSVDKEWKDLGRSKTITDELFEASGFPTTEMMVRFQRLMVAHSELPALIDYLRRPDIVKVDAKTGNKMTTIDPLKKETIRRLKEDYFKDEEIELMKTYGLGTVEVPWAIQSKKIKGFSGLRKSVMDKSFAESPDGMPIYKKAQLQTKINTLYDKYMYMSNVGTHGTTSPLFLPWFALPSHQLGSATNQLLLYKKIPISATYNNVKKLRRIKKHNTWHPMLRWSMGFLSTGLALYGGSQLIGLKHKLLNTPNPQDYEDNLWTKMLIGMNTLEFGSYLKLLHNWTIPGNGGFIANVEKELEIVNLAFIADVIHFGKGVGTGATPFFGKGGALEEMATKWFTLYKGLKTGVIERGNIALNERKEMNQLFKLYKSEEYSASGKYKFFEPGPKYYEKTWDRPKDRPKLALHNAYFYGAHENKDYVSIINSLYGNMEGDNSIGQTFNALYADAITSKSSVKMDKAYNHLLTETFKQNPEYLEKIKGFVKDRDDNGLLSFRLLQALDDNFALIFENNINAKDEFPEITPRIQTALNYLDREIDDPSISLYEREKLENEVEDFFVSEAADNVSGELNEILNLIVSPLRMSAFDNESLVSTNYKMLIWAGSKDKKLGTNYEKLIFDHFRTSEANQYLINYIFNEFLTNPDSDILDNYFRKDGAIDLKPNWLEDENFDSDATRELFERILKIEKKVKKISMYNKRKNKKNSISNLDSLIDSIQTTA